MRRRRILARALSLLWAAFALVGYIQDVTGSTTNSGATPLSIAVGIAIGVAFVCAVLLSMWRWERVGGVLLILAGAVPTVGGTIAVVIGNLRGAGTILLCGFFLVVAPLAAGLLLLADARATRE